jgi:hypothetical protein
LPSNHDEIINHYVDDYQPQKAVFAKPIRNKQDLGPPVLTANPNHGNASVTGETA